MRARLHLRQAAKAQSWLAGATAVHPEHIQSVFTAVMRHRLLGLHPTEEDTLLRECLNATRVP
jgi:MoxR-like ATPase